MREVAVLVCKDCIHEMPDTLLYPNSGGQRVRFQQGWSILRAVREGSAPGLPPYFDSHLHVPMAGSMHENYRVCVHVCMAPPSDTLSHKRRPLLAHTLSVCVHCIDAYRGQRSISDGASQNLSILFFET